MTVVALKTERAAINEAAIELLEKALAEVRAGEIIAIGIAVVRADGSMNCGFTRSDVAAAMLGATTLLQHQVLMNLEASE